MGRGSGGGRPIGIGSRITDGLVSGRVIGTATAGRVSGFRVRQTGGQEFFIPSNSAQSLAQFRQARRAARQTRRT